MHLGSTDWIQGAIKVGEEGEDVRSWAGDVLGMLWASWREGVRVGMMKIHGIQL